MNEKTIAVIGLARAGIPAAKFLLSRGARVVGYDSKTRDETAPEVLELETLGVELHLGEHDFAGLEACGQIVSSPGLKIHHEPLKSILEKAEARGVEVIGELELAWRFCPCPIVAVTGTKGKSTTVKLITEMLRACEIDAHSAGNTGTPLIEILPQLDENSWAVVEVSSFQLEKAPTFRPRVAVLLNLLEDHQDYHPTLEQYWETKLKIFANQKEKDSAIFNVDDPRVEAEWKKKRWQGMPFSTSAIEGKKANVICREKQLGVYYTENDVDYIVALQDIPLKGAHNLANIAAAIEATICALTPEYDVEHDEAIANAIRNFQSLPHRLEIVEEKDGVTWVNDSQSTIPDAAIAALNAFAHPILIAGGRAKIEAAGYDNLGRAIAEKAELLITIGEAAEILENAAQNAGMAVQKIVSAKTLTNAVEIAKIQSTQGQTVVFSPACASFDQFKSYEERGEKFRQQVIGHG